MKRKSKISEDFKASILSSEATSLAKDYSEIVLDSFLNDGVLKDIPVFGSIIGLIKIGSSIREKHSIQKIATFLKSLDEIPEADKTKFLERLDDEDKNGELFERLILILDRLDEAIKAEIIGNLFRIYIIGGLDKSMFLRCTSVVEQAFVPDLISLYNRYYYTSRQEKIDDPRFADYLERKYDKLADQNLVNLGLMEMQMKVVKVTSRTDSGDYKTKTSWALNAAGYALAGFMFYNQLDEGFKKHLEERKGRVELERELFKKSEEPD